MKKEIQCEAEGDRAWNHTTAELAAIYGEMAAIKLREWAVSRWRDEVENRPLTNKNRRSLDDTWRQVIRFAGGDPEEILGPPHDALLAASQPPVQGSDQ